MAMNYPVKLILFIVLIFISLIIPYFPEELPSLQKTEVWTVLVLVEIFILVFFAVKKHWTVFVAGLFLFLIYLYEPILDLQLRFLNLSFPGTLHLVPIILYCAVILSIKSARKQVTWFSLGKIDKRTGILIPVVAIGSAIALFIWIKLYKPDISATKNFLLTLSPLSLLGFGIIFAVLNSFVEEFIFRGVVWDGLSSVILKPAYLIILQALLFGAWHFHGFPRGFSGCFLVFVWGIFLGIIRLRSKGMLAPILTHFFADSVIFAMLICLPGG